MQLLIHILTITVTAFALDCPPKDKIYPCSCGEDQGLVAVNCEGFNNLDELEPAVKNTIGYNVSFGFFRSHLGSIPSDFFKGHTPSILRFEQCIILSFGEKPFSGLENSLAGLHIYSSVDKSATNMDKFKLSHLKKLQYFSFAYNDFAKVGNHWFEGGPQSLWQITLVANNIENVGEKALASLINLQQLHVGNNRIKAVARTMLPNPIKTLWVLEANSNEIDELPLDAFEGYPALKRINLSKNKLKSISESVWGKIWSQLETVYLDGNNIACDENLKWIYRQKLPKTFVGKCGPGNDLHNKDLSALKLEDFK